MVSWTDHESPQWGSFDVLYDDGSRATRKPSHKIRPNPAHASPSSVLHPSLVPRRPGDASASPMPTRPDLLRTDTSQTCAGTSASDALFARQLQSMEHDMQRDRQYQELRRGNNFKHVVLVVQQQDGSEVKLRVGQKVEVDCAAVVSTGTIELRNGELMDSKHQCLWIHMDDGSMGWCSARRLRPHQKFAIGDLVEVTHEFWSNNKFKSVLKKSSRGTILQIDDDGDVYIDFGVKKCWVVKSNFAKLKAMHVTIKEPLEFHDRVEILCVKKGKKRWATGFITRIQAGGNCDIVLDDDSRLSDVPMLRIRRQEEGRRR